MLQNKKCDSHFSESKDNISYFVRNKRNYNFVWLMKSTT